MSMAETVCTQALLMYNIFLLQRTLCWKLEAFAFEARLFQQGQFLFNNAEVV